MRFSDFRIVESKKIIKEADADDDVALPSKTMTAKEISKIDPKSGNRKYVMAIAKSIGLDYRWCS